MCEQNYQLPWQLLPAFLFTMFFVALSTINGSDLRANHLSHLPDIDKEAYLRWDYTPAPLFQVAGEDPTYPVIVWEKTIGGSSFDIPQSALPTPDGGYLLVGMSLSDASGDKSEDVIGGRTDYKVFSDFWVVKIDAEGNKVWDKTIGGDGDDSPQSAHPTPDGGYLLLGSSTSGAFGDKSEENKSGTSFTNDFWVVKIDKKGNKLWDKTLGGNNEDFLTAAIPAHDGGYILVGYSGSDASGDKSEDRKGVGRFDYDYWVVKIDESGNKLWDKTLGGRGKDTPYSIIPALDGGYLLAGGSFSDASGDKSRNSKNQDAWVVKIDENGNKVWDKTLGVKGDDKFTSVVPALDGGYLLAGNTNPSTTADRRESGYWLVKMGVTGNIIWEKTPDEKSYDGLESVTPTSDGGYLLAGYYLTKNKDNKNKRHQNDFWIVKTDVRGDKIWDKTLGGEADDELHTAILTSDGGYLLAGGSKSNAFGDKSEVSKGGDDYWVVKIKEQSTPVIENFTLIDPETDYEIQVLRDGDVFLQSDKLLNIRASAYPEMIDRVVFDLTGPITHSQVEKVAPYALFGDIQGNYGGKPLPAGTYTLTATPYAKSKKGTELMLSFQVEEDNSGKPAILWDKTIGGNRDEEVSNIIPVSGGGYLLAGSSNSGISGDKSEENKSVHPYQRNDFWSVKIDEDGNKLWDKTIGGNNDDYLHSALATSDGGYLLAGFSDSDASGDKSENGKGGDDYWVIKIDEDGNKLWDKTIGGNNDDYLHSVLATSDGGYLLAGFSDSDASGDKSENGKGGNDYWVVKIDANGNKLWDKTIGGNNDDYLHSVLATSGGYLLAGFSDSDASVDKSELSKGGDDYWVIKIDENGDKLWDKTIGGNNNDNLYSALTTSDGGYLLAGSSRSYASGDKSENKRGTVDYWAVKLDANGNKLWDKTIGGYNYDLLNSVLSTPDEGYLLVGYSTSYASGDKSENLIGGYSDYWAVKLDANGNKIWDKNIGGRDDDRYVVATLSPNGNYLLAGTSESNFSGDKSENSKGEYDYWVIKLKENPASIVPSVMGLTLVDAKNDKDIQNLKNGDITRKGGSLSIRANTSGQVDRVMLELQGPLQYKRTEGVAPFALFGDIQGDYVGRQLPVGMYTLTVTPFSKDKKGNAMQVSFEVTDAAAISSFTLINATQDQAVGELTHGDVIDLADFGNHKLNIRANTQPAEVEKVILSLKGHINRSRTEEVVPYAIFGDAPAPDGSPNYGGLKMRRGSYILTATPYADGGMGVSSTISFTVIDSRQAGSPQVRIYPVPTPGNINIVHGEEKRAVELLLFDDSGNKMLSQPASKQSKEQLDLSGFKKGVYYLKVVSPEGIKIYRVVKE